VKLHHSFCLTALLITAACGPAKLPAGQYRLGAGEVFERLKKADLADFKLASQCGLLIHAVTDPKTEKEIAWIIVSEGVEMLRFRALLVPISETVTQVDIAVSNAPTGKEQYDGTDKTIYPAVQQPIRPAIREMIDATLAGRPYDDAIVTPQIESARDENGVCWVQRGRLEAGHGAFSIRDKPGDYGRR
jgi:hypothetical protein